MVHLANLTVLGYMSTGCTHVYWEKHSSLVPGHFQWMRSKKAGPQWNQDTAPKKMSKVRSVVPGISYGISLMWSSARKDIMHSSV